MGNNRNFCGYCGENHPPAMTCTEFRTEMERQDLEREVEGRMRCFNEVYYFVNQPIELVRAPEDDNPDRELNAHYVNTEVRAINRSLGH